MTNSLARLLPNQFEERELPHLERYGKIFSSVWLNHQQVSVVMKRVCADGALQSQVLAGTKDNKLISWDTVVGTS